MLRNMARRIVTAAVIVSVLSSGARLPAADLSAEDVIGSIERGKSFLASQQNPDGSWSTGAGDGYKVGVTSLALLALINSGMKITEPPVAKGLQYLRGLKQSEPQKTYEVSLMIMALAAANDGARDKARMLMLARRLEEGQITRGDNSGSWSYGVALADFGGDRSNGQFAILGLRDAAEAGIPISREVWERADRHWRMAQNGDGGWGYSGSNSPSTGSMTVAGISTLTITSSMLKDDDDVRPDGQPNCCTEREPDEELERGIAWLERNFAVGNNPGSGTWLLYYLYGMERAGRLSGRRYFGRNDWYREGARFLIDGQSRRTGEWRGVGPIEQDPVIGTSFALLFLSKGLAPILINKLKYGPRDPNNRHLVLGDENWNQHPDDIRNLTNLITSLDKWPRLMNWQVVDIDKAVRQNGVRDLLQAPILYIAGEDRPEFTEQEVQLLREYVIQGGFIFAVNVCGGAGFEEGFRELVTKLYPDGEARLQRLPADHPVYRSEYLLSPETVELHGVDFGCRTAIIYSPADLACLWQKWARQDPPNRPQPLKEMIVKATRVGVNVVAYATGREPPKTKLDVQELLTEEGRQDKVERGLLQIAKLRHSGNWDAAPHALRNLLVALNRTVGAAASTKVRDLPASDPNLFKYPLIYMHGRNRFQMGPEEREQLRLYLSRGNVLFADACCGSSQFDRSFRDLMEQLFPEKKLERIPVDHPLFTTQVGFDIRRVKRRVPEVNDPNMPLRTDVREVEPFLEGIEIDGRYAVIYSKYDISCALERQASVACAGYVDDDAVRIALNIVLYGMMQDVTLLDAGKAGGGR